MTVEKVIKHHLFSKIDRELYLTQKSGRFRGLIFPWFAAMEALDLDHVHDFPIDRIDNQG